MIYNQQEFQIKLEWGLQGIKALASVSDVFVIVDILSFSTSVNIATGNGAIVYPYRWKDETARSYAQSIGAEMAQVDREATHGFSLSPASLISIQPGTKLVLPSPNGSTLSLATEQIPTLCGCLRNARAVARFAERFGRNISLIPAGEQWANGILRPSFEDLLGAGAVISYLSGTMSPESKTALAIYEYLKSNLLQEIRASSSGKELIARGFQNDIDLACDLNCSETVPVLGDKAYLGCNEFHSL